jgi:hypothetical protein
MLLSFAHFSRTHDALRSHGATNVYTRLQLIILYAEYCFYHSLISTNFADALFSAVSLTGRSISTHEVGSAANNDAEGLIVLSTASRSGTLKLTPSIFTYRLKGHHAPREDITSRIR